MFVGKDVRMESQVWSLGDTVERLDLHDNELQTLPVEIYQLRQCVRLSALLGSLYRLSIPRSNAPSLLEIQG